MYEYVRFVCWVHGGSLVSPKELAHIRLADPEEEALRPGFVSIVFLKDCIENQFYFDPDMFMIDQVRQSFQPFVSVSVPNGVGRPAESPWSDYQTEALQRGFSRWAYDFERIRRGEPALASFSSIELLRKWTSLDRGNQFLLQRDRRFLRRDAENSESESEPAVRPRSRSPRRSPSPDEGQRPRVPASSSNSGPILTAISRSGADELRERMKWSAEEEALLEAGHRRYGPKWAKIRVSDARLRRFTGVQLKDKFRARFGSRASNDIPPATNLGASTELSLPGTRVHIVSGDTSESSDAESGGSQ